MRFIANAFPQLRWMVGGVGGGGHLVVHHSGSSRENHFFSVAEDIASRPLAEL